MVHDLPSKLIGSPPLNHETCVPGVESVDAGAHQLATTTLSYSELELFSLWVHFRNFAHKSNRNSDRDLSK